MPWNGSWSIRPVRTLLVMPMPEVLAIVHDCFRRYGCKAFDASMKPIHALLLGVAFGLVIVALAMRSMRKPCPVPPPIDPAVQWRADSLERDNARLQGLLDEYQGRPPVTVRVKDQLKISRSLALDTLVNDLMQDPE